MVPRAAEGALTAAGGLLLRELLLWLPYLEEDEPSGGGDDRRRPPPPLLLLLAAEGAPDALLPAFRSLSTATFRNEANPLGIILSISIPIRKLGICHVSTS